MAGRICVRCGVAGATKTVTRGSLVMEVILWLCFLVPGLIYSIWRVTTRVEACRACGETQLVPLDSPMGRKLAADVGVDGRQVDAAVARAHARRGYVWLALIGAILLVVIAGAELGF